MSPTVVPQDMSVDLSQPPGRLDGWARKKLAGVLGRIRWGRIRWIEGGREQWFGHGSAPNEPEVTVEVLHSRFYSTAVFGGSVGLGEAYMAGLWTCDDLAGMIRILVRNLPALEQAESGPAWFSRPLRRLFHLLNRNTKQGSRRNIVAHYDLGNDFYSLFLDPTMTYSCGVFESENASLEEASFAKYERLCRKLQLSPEDHVVEIGTGWGGFAVHAARRFGCRVTTTTISEEQYAYARERLARDGLAGRVEVLRSDYRELSGQYDKLVSIEMIEAVGHEFMRNYLTTCSRLVKPEGLMALQAITITDQRYRSHVRDVDFIKRYIFPGSCLTSVTNLCTVATRWTDLRLTHLEDITPHYAKTLRCWRERFLARLDDVRAMGFPESFIRMWEYYLCYCEGAFQERYIGDVQLVFARPLCRLAPVLGSLPKGGASCERRGT